MGQKLKVWLILFALGLAGVLSLLAAEVNNAQLPAEVREAFTPGQLKLLTLINPTFLLLLALTAGVNLYRQTGLHLPLIERYLLGLPGEGSVAAVAKYGIAGGMLAGILLAGIGATGAALLVEEIGQLGNNLQLPLLTRLLYGGITEELLLRFGCMTLIARAAQKVIGSRSRATYLVAILLAALAFAALHLPVVYAAVAAPSAGLVAYVLAGNSVGGLLFGWLYWRRGLEAAILAHVTAHLVLLLTQKIIG